MHLNKGTNRKNKAIAQRIQDCLFLSFGLETEYKKLSTAGSIRPMGFEQLELKSSETESLPDKHLRLVLLASLPQKNLTLPFLISDSIQWYKTKIDSEFNQLKILTSRKEKKNQL